MPRREGIRWEKAGRCAKEVRRCARVCLRCDGKGAVPSSYDRDRMVTCPVCHGVGR